METVIRTSLIKREMFINKHDLIEYLNKQICVAETLSSKAIVKGIISDLENGENSNG